MPPVKGNGDRHHALLGAPSPGLRGWNQVVGGDQAVAFDEEEQVEAGGGAHIWSAFATVDAEAEGALFQMQADGLAGGDGCHAAAASGPVPLAVVLAAVAENLVTLQGWGWSAGAKPKHMSLPVG